MTSAKSTGTPAKVVVALLIGLGANAARADFFRPDSVTATSFFNSSYAATNTINGSGLPAGFTPASPHADYVAGNHWTTASGHTIGESITWTFATPRTLGGLHMWAHRSNGVADNSFYAITRYDLVLRDGPNGTGAILSNLTNLTGTPGIAIAQTQAFTIIGGVRSVQLIIRATANNNASPFTGLAEVAFTDCVPAVAHPLQSRLACRDTPITVHLATDGSGPSTYAWEIADPDAPGGWTSISNGPISVSGIVVGTATDATSADLSVTLTAPAGSFSFRCGVSNACSGGVVVSSAAQITICPADFNCDGEVNPDDLGDFINCYFAESGSAGACPAADFNAETDPGVNADDLGDFINTYFAQGC